MKRRPCCAALPLLCSRGQQSSLPQAEQRKKKKTSSSTGNNSTDFRFNIIWRHSSNTLIKVLNLTKSREGDKDNPRL